MGGQTALNLAVELGEHGVLEEFDVKLIGASLEAIKVAEDRSQFCAAMSRLGSRWPASQYARSLDEALNRVEEFGFPVIIRPSFTLGGVGGGIAYNARSFESWRNGASR